MQEDRTQLHNTRGFQGGFRDISIPARWGEQEASAGGGHSAVGGSDSERKLVSIGDRLSPCDCYAQSVR